MNNKSKKVYVVGHKNPDTDSICAAITYSYLKNKLLLLSSNIEKIKKLFILTYSLSAIGCSGE